MAIVDKRHQHMNTVDKREKSARLRITGPTPEVMDIRTLARYLGMGRSKIYNLIKIRKIPASKIGRQYRFSKPVIDSWLRDSIITGEQDKQITLFEQYDGRR